MEIIRVAINLEDKKFAKALAKALSRETSTMEFYVDYNGANIDDFDMVLVDKNQTVANYVELVKYPDDENIYGEPPYKVFKYKESGSFAKGLLFVYFRLTGHVVENRENGAARIICFAQITGGSGATSVSLATARTLCSTYEKKAIYINLSVMDDSVKYIKSSLPQSMAKLTYYLSIDRDFPMENFIEEWQDNVDFIRHNGQTQYRLLKADILKKLITKIDALAKYDYIIIDMGNSFTEENLWIIENAEMIFILKKPNEIIPRVYEKNIFDSIENHCNVNEIKTIAPLSFEDNLEGTFVKIEGDDVIHIDLGKEFGREIKEIAEEIIRNSRVKITEEGEINNDK
ncbi:MAG: hypothetical protein RSB02_02920 [Anaerovoracaceae bacterium]